MEDALSFPDTPTIGRATVGIVCESVACLDPARVGIPGIQVVPVPYVIDGRTYLDGIDLSPEEFYRHLERSGRAPATSAPAPAAYLEAFRAVGTPNVVCVTVSGAVSTMAERCRLAIQQSKEQLPAVTVELFDSGTAAMGQGLLALAAARLAQTGATLADVRALLERSRSQAHLLIVLDTLKYLAQTGRLGSIAALAGGVLSIKPIVHCSNDHFAPVEICRTRTRALDGMLNRLVRDVEASRTQQVVVQHAAAEQQAEALRAETARRLPNVSLSVVPFSPVMGTYAGPGLLGFAWLEGQ
ncbi:MAG TPA: DegV family protein [Chloroflexota bacterium]